MVGITRVNCTDLILFMLLCLEFTFPSHAYFNHSSYILMSLNNGTPINIGTTGILMVLGVPILKHFKVHLFINCKIKSQITVEHQHMRFCTTFVGLCQGSSYRETRENWSPCSIKLLPVMSWRRSLKTGLLCRGVGGSGSQHIAMLPVQVKVWKFCQPISWPESTLMMILLADWRC